MSLLKCLTIFLICLFAIKCDTSLGRCQNIEYGRDSLNLNRYLGNWFELARAKSIPFQKGDCTQATYSLNDDGSVRVNNIEVVDGKQKGVVGRATKTNNEFRFKISFSDTFWGNLFKGDYQVADTDYENYAIIYSCTNLLFAKSEFYWILSRTREVSEETLVELTSYVEKKFNKTLKHFRFTDQSENACKLSDF